MCASCALELNAYMYSCVDAGKAWEWAKQAKPANNGPQFCHCSASEPASHTEDVGCSFSTTLLHLCTTSPFLPLIYCPHSAERQQSCVHMNVLIAVVYCAGYRKQLGGKIGLRVKQHFGVECVGDMLKFSVAEIQDVVGVNLGLEYFHSQTHSLAFALLFSPFIKTVCG